MLSLYQKKCSDGFIDPTTLFEKMANDYASAEKCEEYTKSNDGACGCAAQI